MSTAALSTANIHTSDPIAGQPADHSKQRAWLIQGVNEEGQRFRPSDWAERICTLMASFEGGRLQYSSLLYPVMLNGVKCVHLDDRLQSTASGIHRQVMEFVANNQLNVVESL